MESKDDERPIHVEVRLSEWKIESLTGYKAITEYWDKFSISEIIFGTTTAVEILADKLFEEAKDDVKKLTELVMVVNWKAWDAHSDGDQELAETYEKLYEKLDAYCCENLQGEDASYYFRTTD